MKFNIIIIFVIFLFDSLLGQTKQLILSPLQNYNLILIGEPHYIIEKNEIELTIIKDIINKTDKNIVLFLEHPLSMNYFIDKLFTDNDTISLKTYLLNSQNRIVDKLSVKNELLYKQIINIYQLNKHSNHIIIKCIDYELKLRPLIYTTLTILNKYNITSDEILKQKNILNEILSKSKYTTKDYEYFRNEFKSHFCSNLYLYNSIITNKNELWYISKMLKNAIELKTYSEERELMLYNNIIVNYNDSSYHVAIMGSAHVNKYYKNDITILGNRLSVGYLLNNSCKSPFRNKVYSIYIFVKNIKTINSVFSYGNNLYYIIDKNENNYLFSLMKKNITYIVPTKKKFKYAYKAYNLLILIKNGTSNLYDDQFKLQNNSIEPN
jgi:hypothetical protein